MDERLEKALDFSNFRQGLSNFRPAKVLYPPGTRPDAVAELSVAKLKISSAAITLKHRTEFPGMKTLSPIAADKHRPVRL